MGVHESLDLKVKEIFRELAGSRLERLAGSRIAEPAMSVIGDALTEEYPPETANAIAFHMTDWNSDAALIVALHLSPERFTPEEIRMGIRCFLNHAPSHIRAACQLTGQTNWTDFDAPE